MARVTVEDTGPLILQSNSRCYDSRWPDTLRSQAIGSHCTVGCRYNAVQSSRILHEWLQTLKQNINQMLDLQKTPHASPLRVSYVVCFVNICEKWRHYNGTALYSSGSGEYSGFNIRWIYYTGVAADIFRNVKKWWICRTNPFYCNNTFLLVFI